MGLFRKAIEGNENKLVKLIEVESGLWRNLRSWKVLNDEQIESCQSQVLYSLISLLLKC